MDISLALALSMFEILLTHRGIDLDLGAPRDSQGTEGTLQKFEQQIRSGFGIEFDIRPMSDGEFAIGHDESMTRISGGEINTSFSSLNTNSLMSISFGDGERLASLSEILNLIISESNSISALHLKGACQNAYYLHQLIEILQPVSEDLEEKLIIFDATISTAEFLKTKMPTLKLAASVSHEYDIERYGRYVKNTLLPVSKVLERGDIYSWAWLDEWDRTNAFGDPKALVTFEVVNAFTEKGFSVAAVSPELHASSPGLLGGEAHEWGADTSRLLECWSEWGKLGIRALCTDHASWLKVNMEKLTCIST